VGDLSLKRRELECIGRKTWAVKHRLHYYA
jgi:hypothetical protein